MVYTKDDKMVCLDYFGEWVVTEKVNNITVFEESFSDEDEALKCYKERISSDTET